MKYLIDSTHYHSFEIFELGKLAPRSYFIPFSTREKADSVTLKEKRYTSDKVVCLNGEWDFKFYPRPALLPRELDTDAVSFDRIDVPSCWQFRGYDKPFYVNIRYQFPFNPPVIPTTEKVGKVFTSMGVDQKVIPRIKDPGQEYNFVGVYRRMIDIADTSKKYVLSFLGVASCMDLYINGQFCGYSEGSHNTAEFDVTSLLKEGSNEMVVVVHRWCNGSYLEDQDMFRNNGIFRDVLLRISEPEDICDISAKIMKTGDTYSLRLSALVYSDTDVTFTLEGHGISRTVTVPSRNRKASALFKDLDVIEWNASDPTLYTVYYETASGCIKDSIGFRTVKIDGDVFLVNSRKIKFHGVNHHDTSCDNGYTMTPDEIEKDILLCKEFNIDTIRTSHYPADPLLLELAEVYGIYIVAEADLETHGTFTAKLPSTYNTISHDPKWKDHYVDRARRLYHRDKNRSCIVMWSLGNEAGGYYNTDAMYAYLKKRTEIPVHYESAIHCKRVAYDVGSEMYPPVHKVHMVGEKTRKEKELNDRPYFLCEYAHAMGVGPGNIEAYWQEIYEYDNLMGGCIWEMVDHAVRQKDGVYTYGGDHGEWEHDGNFCVDGIFYPDRTPSTGAYIARFAYRPIRISHLNKQYFELFNTTAFCDGSRYELRFAWNDGSETVLIPKTEPLSYETVEIPLGEKIDGKQIVTVTVTDRKTGREVSKEQILLAYEMETVSEDKKTALPQNMDLKVQNFTLELDEYHYMVAADPATILFRAHTDNDADVLFNNTMAPYEAQKEEVLSSETRGGNLYNKSRITNKYQSYIVEDAFEGYEDGILVTSRLHCTRGKAGIVPRFGKTFRLNTAFNQVEYEGRTGESYADMKDQFVIDRVSCTVADMTEPNLRPQESGNRCDCTYASLSNGKIRITFKAIDHPFELSVKPYSDRELMTMKHQEDSVNSGTYVTIQAFQMGIGTGSCGPQTAKEYTYPAKDDYELRFLIQVENLEESSAE